MDVRISPDAASRRLRERLEPTLTKEEQRRIRLRFGAALLATGLLLVGWLHDLLVPGQRGVGALILGVGALIAALPVLAAGLRGFLSRAPHAIVEQLVSLAVLAALAVGDYTTAILVPLLIAVGHFLEERGILGARAAIEGLRRLQPQTAARRREGREEQVPVASLAIGDALIVRPGEVFAADGNVQRGSSAVDASTMTGESVPEEVGVGAPVFAGTVNLSGVLEVRVTGLGGQSAIGRILDVLRSAEQSKPPIVRLLERYAAYYLPVVLVATATVLVFTEDLSRAIAMLVVSCPCALVLASPAAMTAVLAVASRLGILIKNTRFLEVLGGVDTVVLDKTGTTTVGKLTVVGVHPAPDVAAADVMAAARSCARGSRHPVSRAVLDSALEPADEAAGQQSRSAEAGLEVEELHGKGVEARFAHETLRLGRREWLQELGFELPEPPAHLGPLVWVAEDTRLLGCLALEDRPRPEARAAVQALRAQGISEVLLVTGDRPSVARRVADELGIDRVEAECLPERKLAVVTELQRRGRKVLVVGDGVNDALALSRADVGVALGAMGSDVALQSADIALMGNDLTRLSTMLELGRRARTTIYQNVGVAVAASVLMLGLAGAGLVTPVMGAVVHNVGALLVVANSARILRTR